MSGNSRTLSEHDSKLLLRDFGVPLVREVLAATPEEAAAAAVRIGFPVVLKLCGDAIAHKTERGLVRLGLGDAAAVRAAAAELLAAAQPADGAVSLLVAERVAGKRELIAGLVRDPQFGPCVMLGLGGIFAEAIGDVAFAVAPLAKGDAEDLIDALQYKNILGAFRGEPAVDRKKLGAVLEALGRLGAERADIVSIDVNPLILAGDTPVVIDALVELEGDAR
jgi:acetyl-CoA synthetase (ADP-forming)